MVHTTCIKKKTLHTFAPDYELRGLTKIGVKVMGDDNKEFPIVVVTTAVIAVLGWIFGKKKSK